MSRAQLMASILKLEQRKTARLNQPPISDQVAAPRVTALINEYDPDGPMTPANRRARRVVEIVNAARERRDAARENV